jgi:hypothetical protein
MGSTPNWSEVDHCMNESMRAARQREERPHLAITLFRHAELLRVRNDHGLAGERLAEAQRLFADMGMNWWLEHSRRSWRAGHRLIE